VTYTVTAADSTQAAYTVTVTVALPAPAISGIGALPAQTAATIVWTTDQLADSQVSYGTSTGVYGTTTPLSDVSPHVTSHSVSFAGLTPGTLYYYVVISNDGLTTTSPERTFATVSATPGGGGSSGSGGGFNALLLLPTTVPAPAPATSIGAPPAASATAPSASYAPVASVPGAGTVTLVNDGGTFYMVQGGERYGITDPGILSSYGLSFSDATAATSTSLAAPVAGTVPPASGSLVKTAADPTVYLVSNGERYPFTSASVFTALGYRFSSVLTVTSPELDSQPVAAPIATATAAHAAGVDVLSRGTVYRIGTDNALHPYPSLAVYNSWHLAGDFSTVVPANAADLALPVGVAVVARVKG
jgi:hypothetical protein